MAASTEPKPVATGYPAPSSSYTAYVFPPPPPSSYYGTAAPPPPHQQAYYYNYYNNNPSYYNNNNSNRTLLRRLFFAMIAVFVVIVLATMIVWLVLRPRLPSFSVVSANISSFNLSSSNSALSSTFDVTLSVRNPNKKMSIHYDSVDAAVFLGSALVSETSLPPFSQDTRNSTIIPARLSSKSRFLDAGVVEGVLEGKANKDDPAAYINLRLFSWVRFNDGRWATRGHSLRVYCDGLKISFPNTGATNGSLVGGPNQCLVHL